MPRPVDESFWHGRRVLVTGHTGFKGAWLVLWLAEMGATVDGLSTSPPTSPSLFEVAAVSDVLRSSTIADVRDAASVRAAVAAAEPEVILHLAAQAIVRRSLMAPAETFDVNVVGTVNVLDAAEEAGAGAVVTVTSDKCYRDVATGARLREDEPLGGKDPYSASKAAQELVVEAYRGTVLKRTAVATARAGNVIGGGDWAADRLVPDLFRAALAGRPLSVRNPAAVRPWQHVLNPLAGYLLLAQRLHATGPAGGFGEAWNFGPAADDERPVSWIVERLRERWDGPLEVIVQEDPDADKEAPVLRLDSSKAHRRLDWTPRWTIQQGLDETSAWFSAYRDGAAARDLCLEQIARFTAA